MSTYRCTQSRNRLHRSVDLLYASSSQAGMALTNWTVLRLYWRLYAFLPDLRTALTQSLPRVIGEPSRSIAAISS
jgi:hypothetical protein